MLTSIDPGFFRPKYNTVFDRVSGHILSMTTYVAWQQ